MRGEIFGQMPDGSEVERFTIAGGGLVLNVLTYGAVVQDARLEGHEPPLVLGFEDFEHYLNHSPYFGATAGRCINRITGGRFEIDGERFQADQNMLGAHTLHGGAKGMGKRVWDVVDVKPDRITMQIVQADGDMGFPGALSTRLIYACLEGGIFDIRIEATTDKPTLCNIGHHTYWTLDGQDTLHDTRLQVDAETYTEVDEIALPTGRVLPVDGTRFDFRQAAPVLSADYVDHNLCLSDSQQDLRRVGRMSSTASDVAMEICTTEPGLQVYDSYKLDIPVPGLEGRIYGKNSGLALEPQIWPDAINHDGFPNVVLRPGETYNQHTQFRFSKG